MATISSIGTGSRNYSTVGAWLAAFASGGWEGECYNDSAFTEFDAGGTVITAPTTPGFDGSPVYQMGGPAIYTVGHIAVPLAETLTDPNTGVSVTLTPQSLLPPSLFGWMMMIGLAFISHAGGQVAITYALTYLPPAFSSLTLLLQPVVAAILAWILLNEAIGPLQAIGGAIVLAGILIARRG